MYPIIGQGSTRLCSPFPAKSPSKAGPEYSSGRDRSGEAGVARPKKPTARTDSLIPRRSNRLRSRLGGFCGVAVDTEKLPEGRGTRLSVRLRPFILENSRTSDSTRVRFARAPLSAPIYRRVFRLPANREGFAPTFKLLAWKRVTRGVSLAPRLDPYVRRLRDEIMDANPRTERSRHEILFEGSSVYLRRSSVFNRWRSALLCVSLYQRICTLAILSIFHYRPSGFALYTLLPPLLRSNRCYTIVVKIPSSLLIAFRRLKARAV